jgi:hypothetical protein
LIQPFSGKNAFSELSKKELNRASISDHKKISTLILKSTNNEAKQKK